MNEIKLDFRPLIYKLEILTNKFVESDFFGEAASLEKKKGIEFEDFRSFMPGDDASLIDWKASLKTGNLLVRQYTQLKAVNVYMIMDVSNSMLFSSVPKLKCEYAAELAASLSYFFLKSEDLVSLTMINDDMVKFVRPGFGADHFSEITKSLADPHLYGGQKNITKSFAKVRQQIRPGSIVIVLSDFIGLEKEYFRALSPLTKSCDVISIFIRDPEDQEINEKIGHTAIQDPFSDEVIFVDMEHVKNQYKQIAEEKLKETRLQLKKIGVESLVIETDAPFVDPVVRFFARRKYRWQA